MRRRRKPLTRVMGVDASLTSSGIALPNGETTLLTPHSKGPERLHEIIGAVEVLIAEHAPTHICLEGYALRIAMDAGRSFDLGELGGCLKLLFFRNGFPTIVVPPTTLKQFITGKGNAQKSQVMRELKRKWGKSFASSDRADAYALRQFALDLLAPWEESKGHIEALKKAQLVKPK